MSSITKNQYIWHLMRLVAFPGLMNLLTSCEEHPIPIIENLPAIFVTQSRAVLDATIFQQGTETKVRFEYGTNISYRRTLYPSLLPDTPPYPNSGTQTSVTLTGLTKGTTFHYRFIAVNDYGTTYGIDASFTTLNEGESGIAFNPELTYNSLSDIDGNTYKTIQIGTQTWMAENLKTTRLNDAIPIIQIMDKNEWVHLTSPAYCWYDSDSATYKLSNGALYNLNAVNTGKLCPTGWHVPTDLEWTTLINILGGNDLALSKLQETGKSHWLNQNPNATNSSGFTALPCGARMDDESSASFSSLGKEAYWWSSSKYNITADFPLSGAWMLPLYNWTYSVLMKRAPYTFGLSVRCLKD